MMTTFDPFVFDFQRCRKEVKEFDTLLKRKSNLEERKAVLPFFRQRAQLSALCGKLAGFDRVDRIAWEFDLFSDFFCDLVVGDSTKNRFCFIEFEDGSKNSIFQGKKRTREWATRFLRGYSQIVDWFYQIEDLKRTSKCAAKFGSNSISYEGMLVIGRDDFQDLGETERLRWFRDHLVFHSKKVGCWTFDELNQEMSKHLEVLESVK